MYTITAITKYILIKVNNSDNCILSILTLKHTHTRMHTNTERAGDGVGVHVGPRTPLAVIHTPHGAKRRLAKPYSHRVEAR